MSQTQPDDEAPISLQALDAVRRCAETEMRRRFEGDGGDQPRSPKRARVVAPAEPGNSEDDAKAQADDAPAFREVARFAYAAVDRLYGDEAPATTTANADQAPPPPQPLAFLATCDMRYEKSAIREAERLLGFGRLAPVKLACRGVSLLLAPPPPGEGGADADTSLPPGRASLAAAERVLHELETPSPSTTRPRFCHRIQPVGATCSALDLEAVKSAAQRICEAFRRAEEEEQEEPAGGGDAAATTTPAPTPFKFSVVYKARHAEAGGARAELVRAAAAGVEAAFGASEASAPSPLRPRPLAVDLKRPDLVLFLDVIPLAARPQEPLAVLSASPARCCALGSSNTHFRALVAAANGGGGGGAKSKGPGGGGGGGGGGDKTPTVDAQ
jgi:hypothetical protein